MNFSAHKMLSLLLLFIVHNLFFLYHVSAEAAPRKLTLPDEEKIIFTHVRQSLEIRCPVEMSESDPSTYVEWYKGGHSLYMERGYETEDKEGILKIKSVTKEHAGIYTCEAVNGYGFVLVNITVIVDNPEIESTNSTPMNPNSANRVNVYPPTIRKRHSKPFIDEVGGQATFHCVATGQPNPHIFWLKNGQLIQNVQMEVLKGKVHSTLKLRGLKTTDAGTYKCIARNKMGEDQTDYTLEIIENPKPPRIVSLEPANAILKEGEAVIFWCEVHSKPDQKLHIKWFKRLNKEEIGDTINLDDITLFRSGSTFYRPLNVSQGASTNIGVYKSNLLIRNSCKEDSGTYVCLALSDKGYNLKNASLTVLRSTNIVPTSPHPFYFSTSDTHFMVAAIIALGIILAVVVLIAFLCCRIISQKRARTRPVIDVECTKLNTAPTQIPAKKIYPEINDLQSKSKLLCPDSVYSYETESHIAKAMHTKTSFH